MELFFIFNNFVFNNFINVIFLEQFYFNEYFNFQKLTLSYFYQTVFDHFFSIFKMFEIKNSYLEYIIGNQIKMLNTSGDNAYSVFFLQNGIIEY